MLVTVWYITVHKQHYCCQTITTTTTILQPFVRDYPGELVPEETLTHPPSWSSSNLYQFLPSTTIHGILPVQITYLAIFLHNLSPCPLGLPLGLEPSTSYSIHFFAQSVSSFRSTCPYHRNLFCCSINIISSIPAVKLNIKSHTVWWNIIICRMFVHCRNTNRDVDMTYSVNSLGHSVRKFSDSTAIRSHWSRPHNKYL